MPGPQAGTFRQTAKAEPHHPLSPHVPIPQKYADKDKSGKSLTVKPGSQTYNIDLED
jgi:hypothetical protein